MQALAEQKKEQEAKLDKALEGKKKKPASRRGSLATMSLADLYSSDDTAMSGGSGSGAGAGAGSSSAMDTSGLQFAPSDMSRAQKKNAHRRQKRRESKKGSS